MKTAVFLDKDGTLIEDVPYNVDPARIRLLPGVAEGLARLHAAGYPLVVVSNQAGVARGLFPEEALGDVEGRLRRLLAEAGVPLAGFYYCPHHPDGRVTRYAVACACRKPAPGLLLRAARDHALDLAQSWLVGDILDDVEAGRRAGCRAILLHNGNETAWVLSPARMPHYLTPDVAQAAALILRADGAAGSSAQRPASAARAAPHRPQPGTQHPRAAPRRPYDPWEVNW